MYRLSVIHVPSPTLEQRYTVINSIYGEANATRKSFFAKKLKQPVLDKLVTLNPRGVRIAIETGWLSPQLMAGAFCGLTI